MSTRELKLWLADAGAMLVFLLPLGIGRAGRWVRERFRGE